MTVLQSNAGINGQISQPYLLIALAAAGSPPRQELSDARVHYLAGKQATDGHWRSESHRPPLEDSEFTATALCLRALQLYAPPARAGEFRRRVARARQWLEHAQPRTTEERMMQVLGLAWAGGEASHIRTLAAELIAEQRPDGGWAQIPKLTSDAYATGKTLVVLQQTGTLRSDDPVFRRGIDFLLATQQPDGSWHQATRRKGPGLPYFETGFPHGIDQFISYAGSAWATMALLIAVDPAPTPWMRLSTPLLARRATAGNPMEDGVSPLMEAALSGTLADMRRLVASGADVNARSATGLTPLMCAVHDPEKASLLIARGADVKAHTDGGTTPLLLAAAYDGAMKTMTQLLDHGADVNAARKDGTTPLFAAAGGGDLAKVALLIDRGAKLDAAITPAGFTPLHYATLLGDAAMAQLLLRRGANPNATIAVRQHDRAD